MKKLLIISAFVLFGCSTDKSEPQQQPEQTCYPIIAKGIDARGNYIIINYSNFAQKRYLVDDYTNYGTELCEPITLTQQPL